MTDTSDELLPCPFCGGEAWFENYVIEAVIGCKVCSARVKASHGRHEDTGIGEVFAEWNTRIEEGKRLAAPPDDVVEKVAFAIIEGMKGIAAAEHARNFVTGNWTEALHGARAALSALKE